MSMMNEEYFVKQAELLGTDNKIDLSKLKEQFGLWSNSETINYVKAKAHNPEPVLEHLLEKSLRGIGVNFHERFEMSLVEPIINSIYGENAFRKALEKGKIDILKIYVNLYSYIDNKPTSVYLWAHKQAILEEIIFYKNVAQSKGFKLSLSSILVTIPHIFLDFKDLFKEKGAEAIERMFSSVLPNLGDLAKAESFPQPTLEEINEALQFWKSVDL